MSDLIQSLLDDGYRARRANRLQDARQAYNEALIESEIAKITPLRIESMKRLGGIERDLGMIPAALQHYREAANLCRTLDDPLNLAHTIRHIGDILRGSGQLEAALPYYLEALEIYRNHPEAGTLDLANTLRGFALLEAALGHTETAIGLWRDTGALYDKVWQEPDSPYSEADLAPGIAESQRQIAQLSSLGHL
jgi:tetratricopeptide (TPR) repeat protein